MTKEQDLDTILELLEVQADTMPQYVADAIDAIVVSDNHGEIERFTQDGKVLYKDGSILEIDDPQRMVK